MGPLWNIIEMIQQRRALVAQSLRTSPLPPRSYLGGSTERRIPMFGSSTNEGFALDWANQQSRSFAPAPVGPRPQVPRPIISNTQGRAKGFEPRQDLPPMISRGRPIPAGPTDQTPIVHGESPVTKWDGIARNVPSKPSFVSSRRPREETAGDRHAKDLKTWTFDFSQ
jgi:hypothetical protein